MTHTIDHQNLFGMNLQQYEQFIKDGIAEALKAAANGCPKSKHDRCFGATIVTDKNQRISASNVEFDTVGNFCAEKLAILNAFSQRILFDPSEKNPGAHLKAIFIANLEHENPVPPCGDCAQMIYRASLNPEALVVCAGKNGIDTTKENWGIDIYQVKHIRPVPFESNTTQRVKSLKASHANSNGV